MQLEELKSELLKDPTFKKEFYNKEDLAFEISEMIQELRIKEGLTQEKLAEKVGTKQLSIARLENAEKELPSLNFLQRIAKALGTYLIPPRFGSLKEEEKKSL